MTEEQIVSVVQDVEEAERSHGMAGVNRYAVLLNTRDVRRLLEERKRLLAASKAVAVMVGAANCEHDEQCIALAQAIAYAEKEAK